MCRGLAILVDKHNRVICKGLESHSQTANTSLHEDECLKFELIVTDKNKSGYNLEIDLDEERKKEAEAIKPEILKWIKKHEIDVLRWLLHLQSYADRKGNTDNSYQKTKGDTDNSYQETKGNTCNSFQKTQGNTYNSYQKTQGDTYNSSQKTKGNTCNSFQKTQGDTDNSFQETQGDTDNSYQETQGEWYCGLIELKKYPNTTKLIQTAKNKWNLTIVELLSWVANNPDTAKKIMNHWSLPVLKNGVSLRGVERYG